MKTIRAQQALCEDGWRANVKLYIDNDGRIHHLESDSKSDADLHVAVLLPAPANCHSHAFQRAMAGMSEKRGPNHGDSFWTWRDIMYRFVQQLSPQDVQAIAAFVQMEMLEAGFGSVAEFHYLHHDSGGKSFSNIAEMSERIMEAAQSTGMGLCLLPVFYEQAGCKGQSLGDKQKRFGNTLEAFEKLLVAAQSAIKTLPHDHRLGVAPHSLRAVNPANLKQLPSLISSGPVHIHIAEQLAEVDEVVEAYGQRPVSWLLDNIHVNERFCLVHATHMTAEETLQLAQAQAVAGLCPITEANLGDGIFDGLRYLAHRGRFAVGSDSNIRICLAEELRLLEYSQRLKHRGRALLASDEKSVGRTLFEGAALGGAQACGRKSGVLAPAYYADLLSLNMQRSDLHYKRGDDILDSFIFCGDARMVEHVWSAGRHVVKHGEHIQRASIQRGYRKTLTALKEKL